MCIRGNMLRGGRTEGKARWEVGRNKPRDEYYYTYPFGAHDAGQAVCDPPVLGMCGTALRCKATADNVQRIPAAATAREQVRCRGWESGRLRGWQDDQSDG